MSWGGGLGDGCGTDTGEGFRQIIDACKHDPTLFIDILSLGTIVQHSIDNSEYSTDKSFILRAMEDFIIFAGRDYKLTSNGTYRLDVAGDGVLTFNGDHGLNVGGSWQGNINGDFNLNVDHDVSINADNVTINGVDISELDSRVKDVADGLVALSDKVNSLETAASNLNSDLADMSATIQSLISRVSALEEAGNTSTTG
jgi:hypothetical protein